MLKRIALIILMLLGIFVNRASAVEVTCLDPSDRAFTRGTGEPVTETVTFPGVIGPALLKIYNGANDDTNEKVSSTMISLNGVNVTTPEMFNQNVDYVEIEVQLLEGENELAVQLKSKPGGTVRVGVYQEIDAEAAAFIGPEGGALLIERPNSPLENLKLVIPEGALIEKKLISINSPSFIPSLPEDYSLEYILELQPTSLQFIKSIQLIVPSRGATNKLFYYYDETTNDWVLVPTLFDEYLNCFIVDIEHFSIYGVIEWLACVNPDNPLSVNCPHFPECSLVKYKIIGLNTDFHDSIKRAFSTWEKSLGNKLRFIEEENISEEVDIEIKSNKDLPWSECKRIFARTSKISHKIEFNINELLTNDYIWTSSSCKLAENQISIEEVALHEIGHALGLAHRCNVSEYDEKCDKYFCPRCKNNNPVMAKTTPRDIERDPCVDLNYIDEINIADIYNVTTSCVDADDDGSPAYHDCNDNDKFIYPKASEICDTQDNQCPGDIGYGDIDEGCNPETIISNAGIVIDGLFDDWSEIPPIALSPVGCEEESCPEGTDIKSLKLAKNENTLYFLFETWTPLDTTGEVGYRLWFDNNKNGQLDGDPEDRQISTYYLDGNYDISCQKMDGESILLNNSIAMGSGNFIEGQVDACGLGLSNEFHLSSGTHSQISLDNFDRFPAVNNVNANGIVDNCVIVPEIEVNGFSFYFENDFYIALFADDPDGLVDSIIVTGPGIIGSIPLVYEAYSPGEWANASHSNLGSIPPVAPATYTFEISLKEDGTPPFTQETVIERFIEQTATNLQPAGAAFGDITFTWTGVDEPDFIYSIGLFNESDDFIKVWSPPSNTSEPFFPYDGPPLIPGNYYEYRVAAQDKYGNESNALEHFIYEPDPQVSSTSGTRCIEELIQTGWGFTPDGLVELHFRRPDDSQSPTIIVQAGQDGMYDHAWPIPSDAAIGTYQHWAVDLTTEISTPVVNYEITPLAPKVSSTSGTRGVDTLHQSGWDFAPNGLAELHFRRPDGSLSPTTIESIDIDGTFEHVWPIPSDAGPGIYQYWAVDLTCGATSAEVNYEIWP
ncbi:matrixin family metalloprotease [Desulforhopalus singaporensis]|uniref:Putative metal-binding motif-containing protein n=1 Tax=Desulforhopalus singaporensis TaxID=91360 RepID=A0A1H0UV14_9BACT|nr:matrixin family metalloprotease [Desulforhopalus singaporensis]SDP70072.1 Putative metal-binding motif-containing protein [Desulforhopalus singaporensis]